LCRLDSKITYFPEHILRELPLPERFTFPFYYEPHPLTAYAAEQLMHRLETDESLEHNFGLGKHEHLPTIGKMFGVLLIKDLEGKIGFLSGVSGKLAGSNEHEFLVPPVFDMLTEEGFFLREIVEINAINEEIERLENDPKFVQLLTEFEELTEQEEKKISTLKETLRGRKAERDRCRKTGEVPEEELVKQSLSDKRLLNKEVRESKERLHLYKLQIAKTEDQLEDLRRKRKTRSAEIQAELFSQYSFLNKEGKTKSLYDIFRNSPFGKPPAAAGECATPKLLQYAFLHGYEPLAMAEFWWGASPKSEVRKHRHYYGACRGKCEPILGHMLEGIELDPNPLLDTVEKDIEIIYEDDYLAVVNKPSGLLSVPGIQIYDSVYSRLQARWDHEAPLVVHRLDQDTSGILVMARNKNVHKHLQSQFIRRTVIKHYIALLEGHLVEDKGEIHLPLRVDLDDRPRQMVCYEHGKKAHTIWEKIGIEGPYTRVKFFPVTGRTHQLRMHAAHHEGLNAPIKGDDMYGKAAERLCLHAAYLEFLHPVKKERMSFEVKPEF
jgi:tRNA pseudouridine32 synthase/23S rRNA pseudouridine746 synthase